MFILNTLFTFANLLEGRVPSITKKVKSIIMAVKIRLTRRGRKKLAMYDVVVADARAPRDGRFIEKLGTYNPNTDPATINIKDDRAFHWVMTGAQPTDTVKAMLSYRGVMLKKHLQIGVNKGAITQEAADKKYEAWKAEKEGKITSKVDGLTRKKDADKKARLEAETKVKEARAEAIAKKNLVIEEEAAAAESPSEEATETTEEVAVAEAPATEEKAKETPAVEEVKEEAPVAEEKTEEPAAEVKEEKKEADDLKKVEGIGPKIAELLIAKEITTFAILAATDAAAIKEILEAGGSSFASHDPTTWPEQAKMAAAGDWDKLKVWQDELQGGKEADAPKTEKAAKAEDKGGEEE